MKKRMLYIASFLTTILYILSCDKIDEHIYEFTIHNDTDSLVSVNIEQPTGYQSIWIWTETKDRKMKDFIMKITTKDLNFRDTTFYLSHGYILNFYSRTPIEGEYSGNLESDNIVPVWDYIKSIKIGKKELPPKEYSKEKWIYHNRIDFTTKEHEYHLYICE